MKRGKYFGAYLREKRLGRKIGLRRFASLIDMKPSNLCNVEYGRINPPFDIRTLTRIAKNLGFEKGSEGWNQLFDLSAKHRDGKIPADVEFIAAADQGIPVLLRTIDDVKLSKKDVLELAEYVRSGYRKRIDGLRENTKV